MRLRRNAARHLREGQSPFHNFLHRALQTFRATRSMFTTLYAGIRRSQTHTYARSLNLKQTKCGVGWTTEIPTRS